MSLESRQMYENNRTCFILGMIIQILGLIATIAFIPNRWCYHESVGSWMTIVMVVFEILFIIIATVGYAKFKNDERAHYPMLGSLGGSYLVLLVGSVHTPYMWAFGILIGIVVIVYNSKKVCRLASGVAVVENIIYLALYYGFGYNARNTSTFMVPTNFAFVIAFAVMSYIVVSMNQRHTEEQIGAVAEGAKKTEQQAEIIRNTSEQISAKLEEANTAMESLSQKVYASAEAVEQISSSVTMTATAIQTQTEMNANITKSLDNISEESKVMEELASVVKDNVNTGNEIIEKLQKQANETAEINTQTAEMTDELSKAAETVKDIVQAILSISSQTNLLALNASIEAARAGEAGRGFSVVAEEIRKLSEDTKHSAEQISSTIEFLLNSVEGASANMNKSVESSNKQGEMIVETGVRFNEILKSVTELATNVEEISTNVHECAKATQVVMDSISDLSATSEEVAASSESSLSLSNECSKDMEVTNGILADILELSRN